MSDSHSTKKVRKIDAYQQAEEELEAAEKRRDAAFVQAFPIGSLVEWFRGGHLHSGVVSMHGYSARLLATNTKTGNPVWITGYNILQADADNE